MDLNLLDILSPRESLEICSVRANIRPIARFTLPPEKINKLATCCAQLDLELFAPPLFTQIIRGDVDNNEYYTLTNTLNSINSQQVIYIIREGSKQFATELFDLERGEATSLEIGHALGYPTCCCRAYKDIERGTDWLDNMLKNTMPGQPVFASCNRCARLFGDWSVLPDYFPCSFSCEASMLFAKKIDQAGRLFNQTQYLNVAWRELAMPIIIDGNGVLRKDTTNSVLIPRITRCANMYLNWKEQEVYYN